MKTQSTQVALDEQLALVPIGRVRALFGDRSRQWVYDKLRKDPTFPRPVKLGGYTIAWRLSEIRAYISQLPRAEFSGLSGPDQRALDSQRREQAGAA
ncbi:helix-turn-helix transcriptional regulator [Paraburkholderia sediminicola]|uniref:helix-turn-helix transcriptional regulator n=1 Tax=Paraburkholderia sediminicola TaxID=458836 RepID=UPI0038B72DD2